MHKTLQGIWLPLITPLRAGRVDLEALRRLAAYYRDAGLDGLLLFGSTGEGNLLSLSEKVDMISALRADPGGLPLAFGVGGVDTRGVAALMQRLEKYAPAAWLVAPPYYLCPSQQGMLWHYRELAWTTRHPIIAYNVPKRTGSALTVATLERLRAELPGVIGVKECDPVALAALRGRGNMPAICGEDMALLEHWTAGGQAAIPASAHLFPALHVSMRRQALQGDSQAASASFAMLQHLIRLLFAEPNPAPLKKALALQGWIEDELRPPMMPASEALAERLRRALRGPGLTCSGSFAGRSPSTTPARRPAADGRSHR
ncbi:4-hydroxy-tetrahydrodipicolinate synthase [Bordetella hinzii]|uniref:4-hydroxy-tetrahydrodipicolinate synthase family protein n=1 Tax=Bordetella hinzii TaxID=103855 RepID=UPI0013EFFA5A|nr:4-hydroxy-tetrahydrodipicolinate synthase [Bordetella hinzii]QII84105.1 4-hydroxy-tetrahydrodipicolinate synthase [Bordetella hinzii]